MKYSKKFNRDYDFYLCNMNTFTFSGVRVDLVENVKTTTVMDDGGVTAKECFRIYDSTGRLVPTQEPELFQKLIVCKKSINLHIKMWVEAYDDMMEGIDYYMNLFEGEPPQWVRDSFQKQLLLQHRRQRRNKLQPNKTKN